MIGEALRRWLEQQYSEQAEEMARKLQMLGLLAANVDLERVQQALLRDYTRLGNRIGAASMLGMQGAGEEVFSAEMPADPDLASTYADGREYLASLGFRPGKGAIHESWLLCRGSIHYDIIEHIVRERLGIVGTAIHATGGLHCFQRLQPRLRAWRGPDCRPAARHRDGRGGRGAGGHNCFQ